MKKNKSLTEIGPQFPQFKKILSPKKSPKNLSLMPKDVDSGRKFYRQLKIAWDTGQRNPELEQSRFLFDDNSKIRQSLIYPYFDRFPEAVTDKLIQGWLTDGLSMKAGELDTRGKFQTGQNTAAGRAIGLLHRKFSKPWKNYLENIIAQDPLLFLRYAVSTNQLRRAETVILKHKNRAGAQAAYLYALDVIRQPWPKAEKLIASDPVYAYLYAAIVLRDPEPDTWAMRAGD